ncbi:MAG: polyphenol oxidase family protein [Prosthecobacter sp.]|uniref:polyphenol oxidase family protein n=1 Tax=Prosthecobacter sp. TaxID=1965333 RepID=UPI0025E0379A|nr:polyphenol oxidase family protein [Prosthecobacter sp.]MCF7787747.1 polyphenol oxidase family protein [Prosthecobacter sp.]
MTFPALEALPGFEHRFTLRHPDIDVADERAVVVARLWDWHRTQAEEIGFSSSSLCIAEQVHGREVAVLTAPTDEIIAGTDGLISNVPGLVIGIYVADCCAVYLADPRTGAFGILHSGKKGSESGITIHAIEKMQQHFGTRAEDLCIQLSPCIRPPAYEIDFAAQIRQQALDAGVPYAQIHDPGLCTSLDLHRFYSYRMEKGRTGRMLALLGRTA